MYNIFLHNREGSFTRSGLHEVDETEVFKGDENKVTEFALLLLFYFRSYLNHEGDNDTDLHKAVPM